MTREDIDFIGAMNMCDEISNEAYKKIMVHCEEEQPCTDAISRQAVIDAMYSLCGDGTLKENEWRDNPHIDSIIDALSDLPSVSAEKTGRWIEDVDESREWDRVRFYCSRCEDWNTYGKTKYCPGCGAKMVEPQESEDAG